MLIFFILFMAVYSQTNYSKEKILVKSENELKLAPLALNISAPALTPSTPPGGESTEFIEPITDFQEENNLYGNMLEEEEDRNNFREILKDRAYLKQKMVESQK